MKKAKKKDAQLDAEEEALLTSFEKGEWTSVKNVEKAKTKARVAASETLRKDARINIRLSTSDITAIKQKAAYEGIPYQTLISSVLHKYAAGHLRL